MDKVRQRTKPKIHDRAYLSDLDEQIRINETQVKELRLIIRQEIRSILLSAALAAMIIFGLVFFAYTFVFQVDSDFLERIRPLLPTGGIFSCFAIIEIFFTLTTKSSLIKKLRLLIARQAGAIEAAYRELKGGKNGAAR